jgi:hypothetical protein
MSNSQAQQDKFIINVLKGKKNGYFLEIGSNDPVYTNNTWILEEYFNWKGIMIEYSNEWIDDYKMIRNKSKHVIMDATLIDYKGLLRDSPKNIDYLQIDIDADTGSTIKTLEKLDNEILDTYKFSVITFEHDYYLCVRANQYQSTREKSRDIFKKHGYLNVFEDINDNNPDIVFEDWWVHPELVDMQYIEQLIKVNKDNYKKNILVDLSINWKDIYYPNDLFKNNIKIGPSETNTKIIKLDKIYPSDIKLFFIHNYKDTFTYNLNNNVLNITRTDEPSGWGQELVAYLF